MKLCIDHCNVVLINCTKETTLNKGFAPMKMALVERRAAASPDECALLCSARGSQLLEADVCGAVGYRPVQGCHTTMRKNPTSLPCGDYCLEVEAWKEVDVMTGKHGSGRWRRNSMMEHLEA
jgi:hypothetical protein